MPRPRTAQNKGLPPRWTRHHGAYYYYVPAGLEPQWDGRRKFRLGRTLAEAHRAWAARVEVLETPETIGEILTRYELQVVPTKAPDTQVQNVMAIKRLRAVFGDIPARDFKPTDAYRYRDQRLNLKRDLGEGPRPKAPTAANRELEVLSHAFTKAIEWGALDRHPMIEGKFRKLSTPPRDRYVEDWEWVEMLGLQPRRKYGSVRLIQAYLKVKLITGRRRVELLRLRTSDLLEDGVRFTLAKSRQTKVKTKIVEWSDELRAVIEEALAARPVHISPWVFCGSRGRPYVKDDGTVKDGWDSIWQRFVDRVLTETAVKARFTENDLRAKAASDAETLERAREVLGHVNSKTTQRVYRRRPERVKPLPLPKPK